MYPGGYISRWDNNVADDSCGRSSPSVFSDYNDQNAGQVYSDGIVYNNWVVERSYGSSPGLDYADYYAYFVSSGGGVDNYSNADWDSCGIFIPRKFLTFALRTSTTTPVCVLCSWVVTSTTPIGILAIPTGYFYAKKNICRSPIISFNNYAYLVELDGLVFNYNWDFGNSCGYF